MALKIIPKFTPAQLKSLITERLTIFNDAVFMRFTRVGEAFVTSARLNGNYRDRTGNLRSSNGYIILKDGLQLAENFVPIPGPELKGAITGVEAARNVAADVAKSFPSGFVLICVAGMNYAAAVESRGYDVISSSALEAEKDLPEQLKRLLQKID